jgi:hypothetical protein
MSITCILCNPKFCCFSYYSKKWRLKLTSRRRTRVIMLSALDRAENDGQKQEQWRAAHQSEYMKNYKELISRKRARRPTHTHTQKNGAIISGAVSDARQCEKRRALIRAASRAIKMINGRAKHLQFINSSTSR